ncbi:sodium-dependent glucose transporter 1-like protein [Dinothrombium tinctorium]|uniref:Major facilitator superfamily domain-containing protein 4A n=1 Tax=Dinothrombium tinctorium TaxID=1965070 RepID=A0A3S3P8K2_9ACAR|nr:sodium-dependent glucose transporter 1-like protein [Dinothrombium tinctorium]
MPFLPHLLFLLANQAVFGLTTAGIDTASNVLIMELWETQSNRYLQTMHLGYSVGATISPLLARPFVFADDIKNNATIISNSSSVLIPASDLKIIIPFAIAAAISALAGIVFLCAEMLNPYKSPQRSITRKNQLTEKIEAGEESSDEQQLLSNQLLPMSYYYIFVTCAALLFCIYLGIECNIGNFLPMYLRQLKLGITEKTALYISATFNAMYIVMRIISIILAFKLNTAVMLSFSFALLLASNIHMFLSSSTSVLSIWIHIGFIGASCAWVYPGFYAFVEERIDVTNPIGGLFTFSSSVITSVAPLVVGNFIDNNPQVFVFWNLASIICVSILFLALLGTDVWKKKALTRLTVYRIAQ